MTSDDQEIVGSLADFGLWAESVKSPAMGKAAREGLAELLGLVIALRRRVQQLEDMPRPKYHGPWRAKSMYTEGSFVTYDGSVWHANSSTDSKPGTDDTWTLAVKRGRDGRSPS